MVENETSEDDKVIEENPPLPLWQEIQKRTFTNWVNLQLSPSFINDLFVDLSNGLQLIKLIENLTERNLGRRNKRIEHVNQRLDNVSIALDFLHEKEGLNLTNIGPSDIVGGNPKLILGLMWLLFRQYTIAKALPMLPHEIGQKSNDKVRLLQWIRSKIPGTFPLSNLTSDWNDGFALAALVEGCVPGLNAGWKDWDSTTPLENTNKAMELAKEYLGIDKVIAPEDLISSDVDEISVMAYLANFPLMIEAKKIRGSLKNVDRHPISGIRSAFEVRLLDPIHIPHVLIRKTDSTDHITDDAPVSTEVTSTNNPKVYDVTYVPPTPGNYEVALHVAAPEETGSSRPPDSKVKVEALEGPGLKGLNPHAFVGEPQNLRVFNTNPQDTLRIEVIGPASSQISVPMVWDHDTREFEGFFKPDKPGHHSVNVLCNSRNIKESPFPMRVHSLLQPQFWGRGICESLRVGEEAVVFAEYPSHILPSNAQRFLEKAKLKVKANNSEIPVKESIAENHKVFIYSPKEVCCHEVYTIFDDDVLEKYSVNAQYPSANSRAFGPGTEAGMAERKAVFVIARTPNEEVQFAIEGPASSELRRDDIDDKTAVVEYTPSAPGKYYISVLDNYGQNIKNSPFAVSINETVKDFYPDRAKISDIPSIIRVDEVVEFDVGTRLAHSPVPIPSLEIYDPECKKLETQVQQKLDNTYRCSFCPRNVGYYQVFVTLDGVAIPPCPVTVTCVDPDKLIYCGPGLISPASCSASQTFFVIDAKRAGPGHVEVEVVNGEKQKVDVEIIDENDGMYTVKYRTPEPGVYKIKVAFAGIELSNLFIDVQQPADVSELRVEGLDNDTFVKVLPCQSDSGLTEDISEPVVVDEDNLDHAQEPQTQFVSKDKFPSSTKGSKIQNHEVTLLSPISDASKCVATGKGLTESTVGEVAEFKVDTSEAGEGSLIFTIRGPNTETTVIDYTPGNCSAVYSPTHPGKYEIIAKFGRDDEFREHIPGSPFAMVADYPRNPSSIVVIDSFNVNSNNRVAKGVTNSFIVDASHTKHLPITPKIDSLEPRDEVTAVEIKPRIWKIDYTLNEPTNRRVPIDLRYDDEILQIGPFVEVVNFLPENLKIFKITSENAFSLKRTIEFGAKGVGLFDKITAKVFDLEGRQPEFNAVVNQKEPHVYNAVVYPKRASRFGLQLLGDGTPINDKLVEFDAIKPGETKNSFIRSTPAIWIFNKPNYILIEHDGDEKSITIAINPKDETDIDIQTFTVDAAKLYNNGILNSKFTIVCLIPKKSQLYTGKLFHELQHILNGNITFVPNDNPPVLSKPPGSPFSTSKLYNFHFGSELAKKHIQAFLLNLDKELSPVLINGPNAKNCVKVTATYNQVGKYILFLLADGKLLANHIVREMITQPIAFANGPGLKSAIVGEKAAFDIICPDRGQVKVNVKGPKRVRIEMEQKQENTCAVHWTPHVPGTYEILIFVNKSEAPSAGSPYFVKAEKSANGRKTSCFSCKTSSEVTFDCGKNVNRENLTATVTCPDGSVTKCNIRILDNSKIGLTLCPKTAGDYKFKILERGEELPHSPFYVQVESTDLPNPRQVQLYGEGLQHAFVRVDNEFFIDCQKAGYGNILVSIDGPADARISCLRIDDKVMKIRYNLCVAGTYQIDVSFNKKLVSKCPYFIECREPEKSILKRHSWSGSQSQPNTAVRNDYVKKVNLALNDYAKSPTEVQSPTLRSPKSQRSSTVNSVSPPSPYPVSRRRAELDLFVPNSEFSQLASVVVDPRGNRLTSTIANVGKGFHFIQFKVKERGRYTAHVFKNNREVVGSPFSFIAGAKKHGNAEKIQVTGTGLEFAQTNQPQSFMIHTAEAGPGVVNVVIDGPEKPLTKLKDLRDGRVSVEYTTNTPGHYFITILFNGVSVRTAPYCVYVSKLSKSKKQNESKTKVSTPKPPLLDHQTVSTPKAATNVAKISGRGLTRGTTGSITEFDILPVNKGDMTYGIEVYGPSKVNLTTENTSHGINVKFVPLAPGNYNIIVKNNGINVDESPYRCKVDGSKLGGSGVNESTVICARYISQSSTTVTKHENKAQPIEFIDHEVVKTRPVSSAKNITIDGQGMTKFVPGKPAMFKIFNIGCETLFVGVVTAHGPCQQCSVNNCGDGSFLVTYVINDSTPGFVYIRYGNEDLPGSPFKTLPASC